MPDVRLIDANALIRKIKDGVWIQIEDGYGNAIGREKLNPDFAFVINEMPTIDAQSVKRGKWVETEPDEEDRKIGIDFRIECSVCHNENSHLNFNDVFEITGKTFRRSKFCPNCGAYMWGEEDA